MELSMNGIAHLMKSGIYSKHILNFQKWDFLFLTEKQEL